MSENSFENINNLMKVTLDIHAKSEIKLAGILDKTKALEKKLKHYYKVIPKSDPRYSEVEELQKFLDEAKAENKILKAEHKKIRKEIDKDNANALILFLEAGMIP